MRVEKHQSVPNEFQRVEKNVITQEILLERRRKEEEVRNLTLVVFRENPELVPELISNNYACIRHFIKLQPTMIHDRISKANVKFVESLPRDQYDLSTSLPEEERQLTPTFEDLRRQADPNTFTKFTVAFAKVMKERELFVTTHQPRRSGDISMRLWMQQPEASLYGHPDWGKNHDKAVLEAWGSPDWVSYNMNRIENKLVLLYERIAGGGSFVPYYTIYGLRGK